MAVNIKKALENERFKAVGVLSNNDFNNITGASSIGHYQLHSFGKFFTYREQKNIHLLQKITFGDFSEKLVKRIKDYSQCKKIIVERKESRYRLSFVASNDEEFDFSYSSLSIFDLLVSFYFYVKDEYYMKEPL